MSGATVTAAAQAGGAGQTFVAPEQSAYAFSTVLPDKADAATMIGDASTVASAFLGPRDNVIGTANVGINYLPDELFESFTYSESSTFDFRNRGSLLLGLTDGDGQFSVAVNGVPIVEDNFVDDSVINLGSDFGPNVELEIVMHGSGEFVLGSAAPEPATWAMMGVGFAGLGFVGWRRSQATAALPT